VGIANSAVLAKTLTTLSSDKVRPLTDTVSVLAVTEVDYTIQGTVTLFSDADPVTTQNLVQNAAVQFAINLASRIQRDIVPEEIIAALTTSGVYRVTLAAPAYTPLTTGQWANCTTISLTFTTGTEHS
jgi:phage-related baseplate assembly protein